MDFEQHEAYYWLVDNIISSRVWQLKHADVAYDVDHIKTNNNNNINGQFESKSIDTQRNTNFSQQDVIWIFGIVVKKFYSTICHFNSRVIQLSIVLQVWSGSYGS